jgi:hypothetical protein
MSTPTESRTPTQAAQAALTAADDAYTLAVQDAVNSQGAWGHVQQAAEVVRQCRATLHATRKNA